MSFTFQGLDQMISKLDTMDDSVNRGLNKVLKEASEPLKTTIEKNVNRSSKDSKPHAQDDVVISGVQGGKENKFVEVGYESVAWRMYFVELGTAHQKAQHNVERSIDEASGQVRDKMAEGVMRVIVSSV